MHDVKIMSKKKHFPIWKIKQLAPFSPIFDTCSHPYLAARPESWLRTSFMLAIELKTSPPSMIIWQETSMAGKTNLSTNMVQYNIIVTSWACFIPFCTPSRNIVICRKIVNCLKQCCMHAKDASCNMIIRFASFFPQIL